MKNLLFNASLGLVLCCTACQPTPPAGAPTPDAPYREAHRPQFHFSPPANWMNDPNGMVYFEGEYHLFYQYYPDSTVWGPMHWGHAVSPDLLHWQHLPIALYPDSLGYIFSGSAVVDWQNTSGFGQNGQPPLVAIFTHHDPTGDAAGRTDFQYQSLAYSNDRGRSWTKYAGNPVVPNPGIRDFRDPKVSWDAARDRWLMVFAAYDHVKLWASPDLKNWTHLSDFGQEWGVHAGVWECPDLFPLPVDGGADTSWVLLLSINPGGPNGGSATQYFVGDFDGTHFTLDTAFARDVANEQAVWLDWGRDNYAGVTWSDVPAADGRRLFMGWMSNWDYGQATPTHPWRSAMTVPRTLQLATTPVGLRLRTLPVRELQTLRGKAYTATKLAIDGELDLSPQLGFAPTQAEIILEWQLPTDRPTEVGVELSNESGEWYRVGYTSAGGAFYSDRTRAGVANFSEKFATVRHTAPRIEPTGPTLHMRLLVDVSSCELFADEGATVLTDLFFPSQAFNRLKLYATGGQATLTKVEVYPVAGVWE